MICKLTGIDVNYEVIGSGKPILLLHGYHVDHRLMSGCMEPVFQKLEGYKRIYIDLPGMGKTKGEQWIVNSDCMLNVVLDFINEIIPTERFLLAGESYGGYLARGILHKMADRIDGLFLLCPAITMDEKERDTPPHTVLMRNEALLSQLEQSEAEGFDLFQVIQSEKIWHRYRDEVLSGVKLADNDFLQRILDENNGSFSFNPNDFKEIYGRPVLILLGRQDWCVGYKNAWNILDNYPRAAFAVLDSAGHNLQLEQEELFHSFVTEWLTRVREF